MKTNRKTIRSYKDLPEKPLNKEEIEDFILNASPKEKAILMAIGYTERRIEGEEELISTEDSQRIISSIDHKPKAFKEYLDLVNVYALIATIRTQIFKPLRYEFIASLAQLKQYLTIADIAKRYGESYSDLYSRLCKKMSEEEAREIVEATYNNFHFDYTFSGDGLSLTPTPDFSNEIAETYIRMSENLSTLKFFISAFEVWIKRKRYSAMMSPTFKGEIDEIKDYISSSDVLQAHAEDVFRQESGKETKLLPTYAEIGGPDEYDLEDWLNLINRVRYE